MTGPGFIGIGAQKAATTWLFKRLCMHPAVYFPRGKEIHFWDRKRSQPGSSAAAYAKIFEGRAQRAFGDISGEITPAYLTLRAEHIAELAALAPGVRLIVTLRDPVERALSAAAHNLSFSPEAAPDGDPLFWPRTLEPGFYARHLARWLAHFPAEQLLVLDYADIGRDPRGLLQRTARHLGIDPQVYDLIDLSLLAQPYFQSRARPVPDEETLARLRDIYRSDVAALERLLGRPPGWWD